MASKLLLPGFGGKYSAIFTAISVNSVGSDTIDCTRCHTLAVTMASNNSNPAGNIVQLQQSFDAGVSWVNILTAITAGSTAVIPATSQPFGLVRLVGSVAVGSTVIGLVGFPIPTPW